MEPPSEPHSLQAELRGDRLSVLADGRLAWEGSLGLLVAGFGGPVGLRTDSGRSEFELFAKLSEGMTGLQHPTPCRAGPGASAFNALMTLAAAEKSAIPKPAARRKA